jgi:hypothetical protein
VKRRSNGNRAQQRYVVGGAGNGAPAETCMPHRNSINNCDEWQYRKGSSFQQVQNQRQQILIREI